MEQPDNCILCGLFASTECPTCDARLYCSESCLSSDAKSHSLVCTSFSSPPPAPSVTAGKKAVLGILFPPALTKPAPVRVPISGFADGDTGISFEEAEIGSFFDSYSGAVLPQRLYSERNRVRNRDSRRMLEIWHVPIESGSNKCIEATGVAEEKAAFHSWQGPVLVLAMTRPTGFMVDPGAYLDIQPADFRDVADFLLDYGDGSHSRLLQETLGTLGRPAPDSEVSGESEGTPGKDSKAIPEAVVVEME